MTTHRGTDVITVREPEDFLALAPVLMGFHPERSLVLLTLGQQGMFHARVDFPEHRDQIPETVEVLAEPVRRYAVDRVALIAYTDNDALARAVTAHVRREFGRSGTRVVEAMRADAGRWFPLLHRSRAPHGVSYDISGHRFLAEAVSGGRVLHGSRAALAASLQSKPERVVAVQSHLAKLHRGQPVAETSWAVAAVLDAVRRGQTAWPDDRAARLFGALAHPATELALLGQLDREDASAWLELFIDLVGRAPTGFVAPTAAVLGYAAWLSGNGALAWCAVDRCEAEHPDHPTARQLALVLMNAVPPHAWDVGRPGDRLWAGAGTPLVSRDG